MAYYALSMLLIALELAEEDDVYLDMVIKFLEQFVLIARALDSQGLYDPEDGFFYDRLAFSSGERDLGEGADDLGPDPAPARRRPAGAGADRAQTLGKRFARLRRSWAETGERPVGHVRELGDRQMLLVSVIDPDASG